MSKRLTIVLTDDEYACLEQRANQDRRTVRQMAERLVTQGPMLQFIQSPPALPFTPYPFQQPWIGTSGSDTGANPMKGLTYWNGTNPTSGKLEVVG